MQDSLSKQQEGVARVASRTRSLGRFVAKAFVVVLAFMLAVFGPTRRVEAQGTSNITGTVTDTNGNPVAGVRVGIYALGDLGGEFPFVATNGSGAYTIAGVPHSAGPYDVQLLAPCTRDQSKRVVVDGPETVNFTIPLESKRAGYTCALSSFPYLNGVNNIPFPSIDDDVVQVNLPFPFPYLGVNRTVANVYTNGYLNFGDFNNLFVNSLLPNSAGPNAAIYPFWDDLVVDAPTAQVRAASGGVAPNRFFVIEWFNVRFQIPSTGRLSFEVVLFENGRIVFNYKDIDTSPANIEQRGSTATVGIENGDGSAAFQRSFNQPYLDNGLAFEFVPASK